MIRSIRFSLTLWYAAILAVILCVFGTVLYANVSSTLYRRIDNLLASEADGIGESIFSFWKADKGNELPPNSFSETRKLFHEEIENGQLSLIIEKWAEETDELRAIRPARIIAPDGQTLAFSSNIANLELPLTENASRKALGRKTVYETFPGNGHRVRLVTRPVTARGKLLYFVQVATSLHQADQSLERLRTWLCWLIPLTILLTSVVGWFLANLALKPVGKMIFQAQEISEARLSERIDVPPSGDEVQRLAVTFNELLGRLEKGFKRARQFSAAASHELRTPLTVMRGELEWALRKPRLEEDYLRVLQTQLEAVNEMGGIVEQLLAVANMEENRILQLQPVDLTVLLQNTCALYQKIAEGKKIAIEIHTPPSAVVTGERGLLERLISNLLDNAVKNTPEKGRVILRLEHDAENARLSIQDTGKGIAESEIPKIFDKFFSRKGPGAESTGIGLGLCRWIIEAHQGRMDVRSIEGQGAVFTVELPLTEAVSLNGELK